VTIWKPSPLSRLPMPCSPWSTPLIPIPATTASYSKSMMRIVIVTRHGWIERALIGHTVSNHNNSWSQGKRHLFL
jgi:hypothetical protein